MSRSRQPPGPQVRTHSVTWSSGYTWRNHASDWGQLVYAVRGMMTVHIGATLWIVPPHQAVWVPAGVKHDVAMAGRVAMRALYLHRSLRARLPGEPRIVEVSPLLRELLRRTIQLGTLDRRRTAERHLLDVLLDQVAVLPTAPVDLPMPQDPRAVRAAAAMRADLSLRHRLAVVARTAGAGARTLERLFHDETGLSFGAWRQRARLVRSLQLLADGASVTRVALAVGYESTSAFVAAFRRTLGQTPGRYFSLVEG